MSSNNLFEWTRLLGTTSQDSGEAITTGSDGSIYITGIAGGELDGQTNSGSLDAFISKFNSDGTKEWTRLVGSSSLDNAKGITTASDGSIYIAGTTFGDFDGQTNSGGDDAFISKFSADGEKQWTKLFGSTKGDDARAITTGLDGSIYITGITLGQLDGQTYSGGYSDAFISKLNPDGTKEWTRFLGTTSQDYGDVGDAITTGLDGSIYIAGHTYGNLDGQTNSGSLDAFISKFNSDGTKEWTRLVGSSDMDSANGITTGLDGSIYITGYTLGELDDQTNNGIWDGFISKFNPDGTKEWTRLLGSSSLDFANGITTASDGSIYITGETRGDLDGQTNSGYYDAFISKFNPDGTKDWTRLLGSSEDDIANGITTASDGSIYIAGETRGDLDGQTYNGGYFDAFISKLTEQSATIYVNQEPTDISLSSTSFNENIDAASAVATLSTTDADASDSHTYTLVSGTGDTDNSSFTIEGSNLKISSSPDYESKSSYSVRIKTTDSGDLTYEEAFTLSVNDLLDSGIKVADINENYTPHSKGFSSISGSAPVTVTAYEVGSKTTLNSIKDYGGNLHAGDTLENTASSYKYHGLLDVNGDGVFEGIFTNNVSRRWVTAKVDSLTGQVDYGDHGNGGGTRVVGIYEDPLIAEGASNGGFLSDGVTPAPANFGVSDEDRYVEVNGETIDRLALNSQVRFQNDLDIDNLSAKHSGDYDGDGIHEVYWKTNDGTAYLRSLMHDDGNIRYANYQSESQMNDYLSSQGHTEIISDIV